MPLVTMYDSTDPLDIPADAPAVAGYVDGRYAWPAPVWARFATPYQLSITTDGNTVSAMACDRENGDLTDAQSVNWARRRRAAGFEPIVYLDLANLNANVEAFLAVGEPLPYHWLADWTGVAPVMLQTGVIAEQYANAAQARGHFDLSVLDTDLYEELFMTRPQDFLNASLAGNGGVRPDGTPATVGDALADAYVMNSNGQGHVPGNQTIWQRLDDIDGALAALAAKVAALSPTPATGPLAFNASGAITLTPGPATPAG